MLKTNKQANQHMIAKKMNQNICSQNSKESKKEKEKRASNSQKLSDGAYLTVDPEQMRKKPNVAYEQLC